MESVKAVSDLHMPVDGKVVKVNEQLEETPELVNEDPYGDGWVIEIEFTQPDQLDQLKDAGEYQANLETE